MKVDIEINNLNPKTDHHLGPRLFSHTSFLCLRSTFIHYTNKLYESVKLSFWIQMKNQIKTENAKSEN